MFEWLKEFAELGSTVIVVLAFIWLSYEQIKQRRKSGNNGNDVLAELKLMNSNHLHSIEMAIKNGNTDIIKAINETNNKLSEVIGQLK